MPKGDRFKLKADPEDGTTPIANLLLEAVAMAKISGLQKGAILYLWRRTYGWIENGKRLKERKITLAEWRNALDSSTSRLSHALGELETKCIVKRRMADAWGGYYYSINTDISKWNSNSINISKLAERVGVVTFATIDQNATVDESNNSCDIDNSSDNNNSSPKRKGTVDQNATVVKNATHERNKNDDSDISLKGVIKNATVAKMTTVAELLVSNKEKNILNKDIKKGVNVLLTSPFGKQIGEVFTRLDKIRGYKTTKRKAEVGAIMRMIKNSNYTPDQIISTWEELKSQPFWNKQELFMMTVESQIGAITHGTHSKDNSKARNSSADSQKDKKPKDYTGGRYGHMVKL